MNSLKLCFLTMATMLTSVLPAWSAETSPPAPEVVREFEKFASSWPEKIPPDDARFGIVRVLSFLNLDYPGLEKVKAGSDVRSIGVNFDQTSARFK